MTTYDLKLDTDTTGLLNPTSEEARRYCGPLFGPQAMTTLAVLNEFVDTFGDGEVKDVELASRIGIDEERLAASVERLRNFGVVTLHESASGTHEVVVPRWVNPPTAAWREAHYSTDLQEQFERFLGVALNSYREASTIQDHQMVIDDRDPVDMMLVDAGVVGPDDGGLGL